MNKINIISASEWAELEAMPFGPERLALLTQFMQRLDTVSKTVLKPRKRALSSVRYLPGIIEPAVDEVLHKVLSAAEQRMIRKENQ